MTVFHRKVFRKSMLGMILLGGAWPGGRLQAQATDSTLESGARLLRRAMVSSRETPLSQSPEAAQIIAALRSTKDIALLPLFEKMRLSKSPDNQTYAMVSLALLTKDPTRLDLKLLMTTPDQDLARAGMDALVEGSIFTNEQLNTLMEKAPDSSQKIIAADALEHRGELKNRAALLQLLSDSNDVVKCFSAVTLLGSKDPEEIKEAQETLKLLANKHDLHLAAVESMMLLQMGKEKIVGGIPWAAQIAGDADADEGLRYTAISVLLALQGEEGPKILSDMIHEQKDTIQQIKLGLISVEHAKLLKPEMLDPLVKSRSELAKKIGALAQSGANGVDNTAGLVALIKEGQPLILDWATSYSDRTEGARRLAVRKAVISQATIVDNVRDRDYERAVLAAQRVLDDDGAPGREMISELVNSDNRAVVEAVLAGIYRSKAENQSELVMKVWDGLTKTSSTEVAANYAALILAREGKQEPLAWLPGMVNGGTVQAGNGQGLRALAAWYYAKLKGQSGELLKTVLAD